MSTESIQLPDNATMANIFNNITATMLEMECRLAPEIVTAAQFKEILYCTAVLPMPGPSPITVAVSSDLAGCKSLAAALFAVETTEVDSSMIMDTVAELANMLAGQLKGTLDLAQNLGLPKVINQNEFDSAVDNEAWNHFAIKAGDTQLLISASIDPAVVGHYL